MRPGESLISPNQVGVTPGYMESLRIPLIEGRYFDRTDKEDSLPVIIIDEKLARKFWPGRSPLGKRMWRPTGPDSLVKPDPNVRYLTVVGVVRSIKQETLVEAREQVGTCYSLFAQDPSSGFVFSAKTSTSPANLTSAMRRMITELDPMLPLFDAQTMEERIDESLVSRRSPMLITLVFGGIALFLAAVGVYGVLAYLVSQRSRELGIRIALGSDTTGIFRLIMNEGILVIAVGFALGLGSAFWLRRFLEGMLYGVRSTDPVVLGSVTAVLAAASLAACIVPARRATKVDPIAALRQE
jgi:predicted permease